MLLPGGLTLGHAFGYLVAGDGHHASEAVGHGWFGVLVRLAVPLAVGALVWSFAGGARCIEPAGLRWQRLALQQMGLFLVVEVVEHGLAGFGPLHVLHAPTTCGASSGRSPRPGWSPPPCGPPTPPVAAWSRPGRLAPPPPPARTFPRPAAARAVTRDVAATWALLRAPPVVLG